MIDEITANPKQCFVVKNIGEARNNISIFPQSVLEQVNKISLQRAQMIDNAIQVWLMETADGHLSDLVVEDHQDNMDLKKVCNRQVLRVKDGPVLLKLPPVKVKVKVTVVE